MNQFNQKNEGLHDFGNFFENLCQSVIENSESLQETTEPFCYVRF